MSTPRIWTIEEANHVVPQLASLVARQLTLASDMERCWKKMIEVMGKTGVRPDQLRELARRGNNDEARAWERALSEKITEYEAGWQQVEDLGVVVKDPQIGLCDFYGRVDGKLVWLCWRHGEEAVAYYHDLDAGFSGRRPLTAATRARLLN